MRGRPPKPTHIKVLTGNPGKRSLNQYEPKPSEKLTKMPSWITKNAQKFWRRYAKGFHKLGLLTSLDQAMFGRFCEALASLKSANQLIER